MHYRDYRYKWWRYKYEVTTNPIEGNKKASSEEVAFELTRKVYKYFSS